ncbi:MAG: hypothetical protein ABL982_20165, partial [Vicinamibacterales bacterium]
VVLNRQGEVGANEYNRTIGLDGVFSLLRDSLKVITLFGKTFSPRSTGRDLATVLNAEWTVDRYNANAGYSDIQERFNAEMGFIPRTDIRKSSAGVGWTPRPRWRGVRQLAMSANTEYFEDHAGTPISRTHDATFTLTRNDRSNLRLGVASDFDNPTDPFRIGPTTITPAGYDWTTLSASASTDDSRGIYGGGGVDVGGYYGGDRRTIRASLNLLPLETMLVENSYTRNVITLPGAPTYTTNVLSTRVSYSLSPTLFLKAFVQYNDDRRLANMNVMLWSIYRPGSDFYVVYNQGFETEVPGPTSLRTRNRVLSVKLSYWLSR